MFLFVFGYELYKNKAHLQIDTVMTNLMCLNTLLVFVYSMQADECIKDILFLR